MPFKPYTLNPRCTALHAAAMHGSAEALRSLLPTPYTRNPKPETQNPKPETRSPNPRPQPLNRNPLSRFLLDHGADPRESDSEGYCPMHYVCFGFGV